MKAIRLGALSIGALVSITFAASASEQTTSSAVLNSLEVQELIQGAQPADHARLEVHFAVLAEQYAAKASTPADHNALQEYFLTLAKRYAAEANDQRGDGASVPGHANFPGGRALRSSGRVVAR